MQRLRIRRVRLGGGAAVLAAILCALLGGVAPGSARAQQGAPSLAVNQVDASAYPKLTTVLTVLDANGVPVGGLSAQQFHVFDGTASLPVGSVQPVQDAGLHLSVTLVIDTSGSMAGAPLAQAKQAATDFVNALGPNDDVSVVAFADAVRPVTGFTSDRAALAGAIGSLQAGGATALYEAVQSAVRTAGGAPSPRKAVVFLTDGQNDTNTSQATATGATSAATSAGVPIFAIGFGDQPDAVFLQSLAGATHGAYSPATSSDIGQVYGRIAAELRAQYVLTLQAALAADGGAATLRVTADTPGGQAVASAGFTRGAAAVAPAVTAVATAAQAQASGSSSSSSGVIAAVVAAVVLVLVAGIVLLLVRRLRAARRQRAREREAGRQSDEAVPQPVAGPAPDADDPSRGRLVEVNGTASGRSFEFGSIPLSIGSGARCTVRLAAAADVAPEHALVWARAGKLMLRHVGGARRKTLVGSRPVDWVILEDGDEFAVGPHRYRAERVAG